jgi:hypothetical protein
VWGKGVAFESACPTSARRNRALKILLRLTISFLAHRLAGELQPIGVMNQPVETAIGQRRITNLFMPVSDRYLRGKHGGPALITIITEFQKVTPFTIFQGCHREVIQHQNVDTREPHQQTTETAVCVGDTEFAKEFSRAFVQNGVTVAASLLRERTGQPCFFRRCNSSAIAPFSSPIEKNLRCRSAAKIQRCTTPTALSTLALSRGFRGRAGSTATP